MTRQPKQIEAALQDCWVVILMDPDDADWSPWPVIAKLPLMLAAAFRDVPQGFPGLLERIGDRPLPRARDYFALRDLLIGGDPRGANALRDSGRITFRKLEVLSSLDPRWRHANTLSRIDTPAEATRFNSAVEFIQAVCSRAHDEVVAAAIANMAATSTLPRLLDRFVRRADLLPSHPISTGDNELRPFTTMRDYLDAARRYRNCLGSKLDHVAAGRQRHDRPLL